jgi:hypothetical protein
MINGGTIFKIFKSSFSVVLQEQECQNCKTAFEYQTIFFKDAFTIVSSPCA